jgi:hypothetical protein
MDQLVCSERDNSFKDCGFFEKNSENAFFPQKLVYRYPCIEKLMANPLLLWMLLLLSVGELIPDP